MDSDDDDGHSFGMMQILQHLVGSGMFELRDADDGVEGGDGPVLEDTTIDAVAKLIREGTARNIVIMSGAGVSTAAGIPDFRTPGTGIYSQLEHYNLPDPSCMFEINFFKEHPEPFVQLSKTLYPGNFPPTLTHCFVRLLDEKGLLLRNYTQNIDNLERIAGVSGEKMVEAHGTFATCHCVSCGRDIPEPIVKAAIMDGIVPRCDMHDPASQEQPCQGIVKPDIIFFGEQLPRLFFDRRSEDMPVCDLLIIMGTSLKVHPFASLVSKVNKRCPRLLINRERVGEAQALPPMLTALPLVPTGLNFESPNRRDALFLGNTDDGVRALCQAIGGDWEERLDEIYAATRDLSHATLTAAGREPETPAAAIAALAVTTPASE